ncbi:hypothetical protein [Acinetobacter baumannii]|uniref:hypothetical protein n=1 Tax=Acinetobacter baumannii TaxID=470 RepID=UPI0002CEEB30|nr:hypothetical protein [Acinetobacter baumannii]ENV30973.1 hypothetical protein F961_00767 [Acinetobacter baumannii NIPH 60]MCZ2939201.1 hypothetical protein [Acinetobacter baumannii]MCZ3070285.1 hypothetical protein [Acinetobacter baumannii]MCZ3088705.1 hypothetical protein [Acinetobacter baumannii]MDQ8879752.1 hypothetical protein [Acinetobacter baumannii]
MLVMSDKQQPKHVLTNIDSYIPFSIEFSDSGLADLYWRCGNGKTCLFELGLSNTGEVINITLVSIYYFKNEELYFGFNSNKELSSIHLTNITAEEVEIIKRNFSV